MNNIIIPVTETLERYINQNGVRPGSKKLKQFRLACKLRGVPSLYSQENKGDDTTVFVKIFDPLSSVTYYITEWDKTTNESFGYITGVDENELRYSSLDSMAFIKGKTGIGYEIDVWFLPTTLGEIKRLTL